MSNLIQNWMGVEIPWCILVEHAKFRTPWIYITLQRVLWAKSRRFMDCDFPSCTQQYICTYIISTNTAQNPCTRYWNSPLIFARFKINGHVLPQCHTNSKCATLMKRHRNSRTLIYGRVTSFFINKAFNFWFWKFFNRHAITCHWVKPVCELFVWKKVIHMRL